jgi:hypothetical protein
MPFATETLLAVALVVVYLVDSASFLALGEAVIATRRGALRGLSSGSAFELGGRRPFVPNPLTPFWPELHIEWATWSGPGAPAALAAREMREQLLALRGIGALSGVCALLVVGVAPLALALSASRVFVACALLCYLLAALAGALIVARRRAFGLTLRQAIAVLVVGVVCLPCSGNLARAAAGRRRWLLAASEIPELGFSAPRAASVRRELAGSLRFAARFLEEDGAEARIIGDELARLERPA